MTKFFKELNESGDVVSLLTYDFTPVLTDPLIVEITEDEYNEISAAWDAENEQTEMDKISNREFVEMLEGVL